MTHVSIKVLHAVINLNHYCFLNRHFSSCDETGLKRSASYPLIHSEAFQLATTEGKHTNQGDRNNLLLVCCLDCKNESCSLPCRPRNAACRGHAESLSSQQEGV